MVHAARISNLINTLFVLFWISYETLNPTILEKVMKKCTLIKCTTKTRKDS